MSFVVCFRNNGFTQGKKLILSKNNAPSKHIIISRTATVLIHSKILPSRLDLKLLNFSSEHHSVRNQILWVSKATLYDMQVTGYIKGILLTKYHYHVIKTLFTVKLK
jgi:hypothetical protein